MAYDFRAPTLQQMIDMATQRNAPVDAKSQIDGLFFGSQNANAAPNYAQGTQLAQAFFPPQTQQPVVPSNAVNATIENGAQSEAQANAQAQQAASEAQAVQNAQNATPQYDLRKDLLATVPEPASPAEQYMNERVYQNAVAPKLNAALLPVREAVSDANEAAIQRAYPDTVMGIQRDLVRQLAAAKQQYDVSKAAGDENGMALAHQAANVLRGQADAIGLNLDQFGGNEDTAAMAQALANNDARAMQSLIGGDVPPEQYYQERYNAARQHGFSRRKAEGYAQAQTDKYQADRYARMQQAFFTYGLTDRGSINPFGVQLFGKMMQDNPETVGLYAKMFGLPVDDYKLGNQRILLSDQNQNAMTQNLQKHGFDLENIQAKAQFQAMLDKMGYDHDTQMKILQLLNPRGGNGGGSSSGEGNSSGGGSSSGGKLSPSENEIINTATNMLNDVKTGNATPSELHDYVYSKEIKGKLKPNDLDYVRSLDYAALFYYYKSHGIDGDEPNSSGKEMHNVCVQIANNTSPEWRDTFLPEYNFDGWVGVEPIKD